MTQAYPLVFKNGVVLDVKLSDPKALINQMAEAGRSTPVGTNFCIGPDYWIDATDLVFMMPTKAVENVHNG
jgi:hypothetical protein